MIDTLIEGLRANSCTVHDPIPAHRVLAAVVEHVSGLVACNADVALPGIADALRAADGIEVLLPGDVGWSERLAGAAAGITGARLAVAEPATIALAAAPGSPRATSLLPPAHLCVLRVADVVADLAAAFERVASDLPSALTWVAGPSRTADLEMITTLGVHGPRTVDVFLVD